MTLIFRGLTLQRSRKNLNLALLTLVTLAPFVRSDLASVADLTLAVECYLYAILLVRCSCMS
uniref:Uncharacterized protein n=1 Tax=Picea glauca TaxID=3330 RepID=A0A117NHM0_PICGL|nr:hypothetical protein ABT39_MTgene4593 [Picea glauca]